MVMLCGFSAAAWSEEPGGPNGAGGTRNAKVVSANLYVGADFTGIAALDPNDPQFAQKLLAAVVATYGRIVASDFPKRADALAREIVERGPDLVALQEVSLIRRQFPGDFALGGSTPATEVHLDYLAILLDALERHGGHYAVAAAVDNTDVEVPLAITPFPFTDIRLTDRDVILVRTDLPSGYLRVSNAQCGHYQLALPLPIGIDALRGWCSIDVWGRGRQFRFINTHLEDALPVPIIQAAQAFELLMGPANTALPVVLAGDFNSDANGVYFPATYNLLTGLGRFEDAWSVVHPGDPGFTWGHDELLANPLQPLFLRIDLVLYRGGNLAAEDAEVVDPFIGAPPPLWPSDHAAVFADLKIQ
jgi:endonuclease/exonuclease/phosphatase family metal-dependent hydrolase